MAASVKSIDQPVEDTDHVSYVCARCLYLDTNNWGPLVSFSSSSSPLTQLREKGVGLVDGGAYIPISPPLEILHAILDFGQRWLNALIFNQVFTG
jgi:hypothetical protein